MLNREQILAASHKPVGTMPIEEWGGDIGIRRLTLGEVEDYLTWPEDEGVNGLRRFAALVLCDDSGQQLFAADDPLLLQLGYSTLLAVQVRAMHLNMMTPESREQLRKNSVAALVSDGKCG